MRGQLIAIAFMAWGACLAAPAAATDGPLAIHPDVWAAYQVYLGERWPGAFAVSRDGTVHGQETCPAVQCALAEVKRMAVRTCRENNGGDCVVFAVRDAIKLEYRIMSREEASVCPLSPVPNIEVDLVAEEPGFDHGRSVAHLTEQLTADERHWLDEHGTVMGLTEHSFNRRKSVAYISAEGRNGTTCAGFSDGEIELRLRAKIYVAREIPEDTCLYREVLAHEQRHQALGTEMAALFARQLEENIAAKLAEQAYIEVPSGKPARQIAADRLEAIIDETYAVFSRDHSRRQLAIDSQAEYERTETACPGETDKYLP